MAFKLLFAMFATMALLFGFLFAILAGVGYYYSMSGYVIVGLAIALVIVQWWVGPYFVKWTVNMSPLPAEYDWIRKFVKEHCAKTKTPEPKEIFIGNVGEPNAFVWGRTSRSASMCITRGLFNMLSKDEVKAVVGHELGHIKNKDMVIMTIAGAIPTILYFVAIFLLWGPKRDRDSGGALAVGMAAYLIHFISQFIVLYLSRTREYYADHFSATTHKQPLHLASALAKITYGMGTTHQSEKRKDGARLFGIADPISAIGEIQGLRGAYTDLHISEQEVQQAMEWERKNPLMRFMEIFRTHPLTFKRVAELQRLAKKS